MRNIYGIFVSIALSLSAHGANIHTNNLSHFVAGNWLSLESKLAETKILEAITQSGVMPGVVIASPSKNNPNYYFHWTRDGALTMNAVVELAKSEASATSKWIGPIDDYVSFSRFNQTSQALTGLGEPKFNVDGSPFDLPWGRPQNDGPALRAIALTNYANWLIAQGQLAKLPKLYDSKYPTQSVIKADLEYVASHWQDPSFDLWEEVKGNHFYTLMVQRKALIQGSALARYFDDLGAADFYLKQAQLIEVNLAQFWKAQDGFIHETLDVLQTGPRMKKSNLDVGVLLGVLHGAYPSNSFNVTDNRVVSTMQSLNDSFKSIYDINKVSSFPGVAIGRYPEDTYNGANNTNGNPWVLATLAFAQANYEAAAKLQSSSPRSQAMVRRYVQLGDSYVARVALHANPDGTLSEQFDRNNGYMTSANNLTWNYVAVLTTLWAHQLLN